MAVGFQLFCTDKYCIHGSWAVVRGEYPDIAMGQMRKREGERGKCEGEYKYRSMVDWPVNPNRWLICAEKSFVTQNQIHSRSQNSELTEICKTNILMLMSAGVRSGSDRMMRVRVFRQMKNALLRRSTSAVTGQSNQNPTRGQSSRWAVSIPRVSDLNGIGRSCSSRPRVHFEVFPSVRPSVAIAIKASYLFSSTPCRSQ